MEFFKIRRVIPFMRYALAFNIISIATFIAAVAFIAIRGLNFSIEFTGGTVMEVGYQQAADVQKVRTTVEGLGFSDSQVQTFGTARDVMIRLALRKGESSGKQSEQVMAALKALDPQVELRRVEFVGPQVGEDLTEQGILAVVYALIGIFIYVMFRFQWRFSVGAVVALIHDVTISMGIISVFQIEFDLTVVAALLAVIGYSLNDTIVVFDRIRENFRRMRRAEPVDVINTSLTETLGRTLVTSLTTILVLLALFFLGGEIIHGFAFALLVGVFTGTYSSIYVASPSVIMMGVSKADLMPVQKEGAEVGETP